MLIDSLFKRLYRPLCLYAMHWLDGDIDEAEDIVQDCFVHLWERGADNARAFLYASVRNACIDRLRRRTAGVVPLSPSDLDGLISDDEAVERSEREARLWEAIDALPERCREIFLMSKRDGMTYAETARELGLSVKTVEHQVAKALRRLRHLDDSGRLLSFVLCAY